MDTTKIEDLKKRIEAHPKNVLDRFVLSKIYYDNHLWPETILECEEILKLKPGYLVVHIQLGTALIETGEAERAKSVLEQARKIAMAQKHNGMIPEIEELLETIS